MTLIEIATQRVAGCRDGTDTENLGNLYAEHAVSVEPKDYGNGRVTEGLEGICAKHDWFAGAFDVVEQTVVGPFLHGDDKFAVMFDVDAKDKDTGEMMLVKEIGVYHVEDGKIVREEFFERA